MIILYYVYIVSLKPFIYNSLSGLYFMKCRNTDTYRHMINKLFRIMPVFLKSQELFLLTNGLVK